MGKREKIILAILLSVAGISALLSLNNWYMDHTVSVADAGGIYSEGIIGQPRLINPLLATSSTDTALTHLVFSGLYKYDGNGKLAPDLAESLPEISEDQKTYTVRLRKDVKWHNNKAFTADDVVFTIRTLQDSAYNSPLRGEWLSTEVAKIDDFTVTFQVRDVSGPFVHNLVLPMVSKAVWENVSPDTFVLSKDNLEAVGTGPYLIKEIKKLPEGTIQSIKLEAFSNHYGGRANIDSVQLTFYNTYEDVLNGLHGKQISGFGFLPLDKNLYLDRGNKDLSILSLPMPQYQAAFFNLANKTLSDKNVRKALALATDKRQVIDQVFGGNGLLLDGPILPEQVIGIAPSENKPDLEAAQKLLDGSGWKVNQTNNLRTKGNTALEFTLATNDFPLNVQTAEMLATQWSKLNVKINLNILSTKELTDSVIRPRKFDVLLFAQKLGADPDPFIFWHSSQSKNPGLNLTGFSNAAADRLISEGRTTTNVELRNEKYRQFQNLITEEAPAIFLNQSVYVYAINRDIKGVTLRNLFDSSYRFQDIANWYLDERRIWK